MYLFLLTVADAQGLSYYSENSIAQMLSLDAVALIRARQELIGASLIAYCHPLYQVLSFDERSNEQSEPLLIGQVLRESLEKKQ